MSSTVHCEKKVGVLKFGFFYCLPTVCECDININALQSLSIFQKIEARNRKKKLKTPQRLPRKKLSQPRQESAHLFTFRKLLINLKD